MRHETLRCLGYQKIPALIRIFSGVSEPVRGVPRSIAYYLRFRQWKNRQRGMKITNAVDDVERGEGRILKMAERHGGERIFAQLLVRFVFSAGSVVQRKQPYHRGNRCVYKRAATFEPSSSSSLLEDSKGDSYVVPS